MTQRSVVNVGGVYQVTDLPNNIIKSNWTSGASTATFLVEDELSAPDSNITSIPGFGATLLSSTLIKPTKEFFGLNTGTGGIIPGQTDKIAGYNWGMVRSHDNQRVTWKDIQNQISHAGRIGYECRVTITAHTYLVGETVEITGIVDAGFNGIWTITNIIGSDVYYTCNVSGLVAHATLSANPVAYNYTHLDNWVRKNKNRKKIYTVYQTPTYLSARPNDRGPYGLGGWNAEPSDFSTLQAFVQKTAQRYLDMGMPIEYWEVSNEPNLDSVKAVPTATGTAGSFDIVVSSNSNIATGQQVYGTGIGTDARVQSISGNTITLTVQNSGTVSGSIKFMEAFFSGSVSALSATVKAVASVKNITPTAKIISPSLTNLDNSDSNQLTSKLASTYFSSMMNASDGAGGTMKDHIDVIGIHFYGTDALLKTRIDAVKSWAVTESIQSKPIFDTETGISANQGVGDFYILLRMMRLAITSLCSGISAHCYYQLGDETIWGYSLLSRPDLLNNYNFLIGEIIDYGITSAAVYSDGTVAYTCNGKQYVF